VRLLLLLVVALALPPTAACTRQGRPATVPASAGERVTGRVAITGNEPVTELTLLMDSGGSLRLLGDLSGELRALAGATVGVSGRRTNAGPSAGFTVVQYEVLSIDGQRPVVGIVTARDGRVLLVGAEEVELVGVPPQLASRVGAKVWVVGPRSGVSIDVRSFGVIREPGAR
jgi:hypothetical protein